MAVGLKLLGLLFCVVMVAGDHHFTPDNTLQTLAEMQRDIYLRTAEFFNTSVTMELGKMMAMLKAIEARVEDVEGRLEDYAARTGSENEVPMDSVEPEPEPTTTTRKPKTTRRTTTRRTTTTTLPPTTTTMPTTIPTTTPTTTQPPTTTPMPTPATCAELAQRGETVSGTYLIDPTRSGNAFYVECELPEGVTSIGHSVVNQEVINDGNEDPGSFSLNPMYDVTIEQMKALTAASQNCSQFIKYRCKGAVLLAQDKKTGMRYGYWVSVDGEQVASWGGAPVNSEKCACAFSPGGCMEPSKNCNCDSNPRSFAVDKGLITDKPYLPVTNVFLGDTGNKKEQGFVTLGPLRCQ